jgi:hypothetical protein
MGLVLCLALTSFKYNLHADQPNDIVQIFLKLSDTNNWPLFTYIADDLILHKKDFFTLSEKDGKWTINPPKDPGKDINTGFIILTIDKKNWYMRIEDQNAVSLAVELGVYFRKDKTKIIAVGKSLNDGYKECQSRLGFYELCVIKDNQDQCQLKEVTRDIFPSLNITHFLKESPSAKQFLAQHPDLPFTILYQIPRVGTTITATPVITSPKLPEEIKKINTLSTYKNIKINWNKNKEKFEIGAKETGPITLQEN